MGISVMGWIRLLLLVVFIIILVRYIRGTVRPGLARRRAALGFAAALTDTYASQDQRRPRTAEFKRELAQAAQLPLKDAASALWLRKARLDRVEFPPAPTTLAVPDVFEPDERSVTVIFDWANAHYGPTFLRLKAAHPHASDTDVETAIKAAVQLAQDGNRHFASTDAGLAQDVRAAVERARLDNPGYLDTTYAELRERLLAVMR